MHKACKQQFNTENMLCIEGVPVTGSGKNNWGFNCIYASRCCDALLHSAFAIATARGPLMNELILSCCLQSLQVILGLKVMQTVGVHQDR